MKRIIFLMVLSFSSLQGFSTNHKEAKCPHGSKLEQRNYRGSLVWSCQVGFKVVGQEKCDAGFKFDTNAKKKDKTCVK